MFHGDNGLGGFDRRDIGQGDLGRMPFCFSCKQTKSDDFVNLWTLSNAADKSNIIKTARLPESSEIELFDKTLIAATSVERWANLSMLNGEWYCVNHPQQAPAKINVERPVCRAAR